MRLRLVTTHYVVVWSTAASGMTKDSASYAHRIPLTLCPRALAMVPRIAWPSLPHALTEGVRVTSWHEGMGEGLWGCVRLWERAPKMHPIPMGVVGIDGGDVT